MSKKVKPVITQMVLFLLTVMYPTLMFLLANNFWLVKPDHTVESIDAPYYLFQNLPILMLFVYLPLAVFWYWRFADIRKVTLKGQALTLALLAQGMLMAGFIFVKIATPLLTLLFILFSNPTDGPVWGYIYVLTLASFFVVPPVLILLVFLKQFLRMFKIPKRSSEKRQQLFMYSAGFFVIAVIAQIVVLAIVGYSFAEIIKVFVAKCTYIISARECI